jgi:hypothetical protein
MTNAKGKFTIEWLDEFMSIMRGKQEGMDEDEIDSVFEYQIYIRCLTELSVLEGKGNLPTPQEMADKYFPMLVDGKFT